VNNRSRNRLPKRASKREALTYSFLNIRPRFFQIPGSLRPKLIFPKTILAVLAGAFLLTLQPNLSFPPIKQSLASAQQSSQSAQIESSTLPQIQLPHPGYVSTRFSSYHPGIDLAMGFGTPIRPITEGIVEAVNFGFLGYGNNVLITHPGNLTSLYAFICPYGKNLCYQRSKGR
jgi:murein DD-endopeptidase MepM/ murein hydrolase activator NlpD